MILESDRLRLHMAAWYGDRQVDLPVPSNWEVQVHWPRTSPPLTRDDLVGALERPAGQPPLRVLARGRLRPVVIVDDLTRPTPVDLVLPIVLEHLRDAGIRGSDVTVLLASGGHGLAPVEALVRKVGPEIAAACRLVCHDGRSGNVRVGRTSFGSPVYVDREVARGDLLIGIGGVYPQHSVGFGGGSKLALGVLGHRSIVGLHYGHPSVAGTYDVDNDFRRDLDEMAAMIGLRTMVTLHVDHARRPVRIVAGDHLRYYLDAVEFSRHAYAAPLPDSADVVIANAYPMDISLTFARSKGMAPLAHAGPSASRLMIAACPEGLGYHAFFPYLNGPRFERQRHHLRQLSVIRPAAVPGKVLRRGARAFDRAFGRVRQQGPVQAYAGQVQASARHSVLLFAPRDLAGPLPAHIPGVMLLQTWDDVLARICAEQAGGQALRVAVYPCAPLHCLGATSSSPVPTESREAVR